MKSEPEVRKTFLIKVITKNLNNFYKYQEKDLQTGVVKQLFAGKIQTEKQVQNAMS